MPTASAISSCRSCVPACWARRCSVQRLALERGKPDAQRETGYQQRDEALIEGGLKQLQRRYDPEVEKATLRYALKRYFALPAAQRVAEFDAVFGTSEAEAAQRLDALYAGTRLGDEATRLAALKLDAAALAASDDALLQGRRHAAARAAAPGRRSASSAPANCCACARPTCRR